MPWKLPKRNKKLVCDISFSFSCLEICDGYVTMMLMELYENYKTM